MKISKLSRAVLTVLLLMSVPLSVQASSKTGKDANLQKPTYAYVGCRTTKARNARGEGISLYKIDNKGNWNLVEIKKTEDNPSYLAFDKTKKYLYSVHGDFNDVSSFKIGTDGRLTFLNSVKSQGRNPVFITPNKTNKFMFVATLQGGAVASLPINEDGTLGEAVSVEHLEGLKAGGVSHAHQCQLDKTEQFMLVPSQARKIGYERVWVFKIDDATGKLTRTCLMDVRSGSEPRHIAMSPDNKHAYLVTEKGNNVMVFDFDDTKGTLTPRQIIPCLPDTYTGEGQASASLAHPSGKYVYASNRLHESLAAFKVNPKNGFLSAIGFVSCEGKTPRFMCFNYDATQIIVGNEDSDTIKFFDINAKNGSLKYTGQTIATGSPTCIIYK